jgi:hypothetical protein
VRKKSDSQACDNLSLTTFTLIKKLLPDRRRIGARRFYTAMMSRSSNYLVLGRAPSWGCPAKPCAALLIAIFLASLVPEQSAACSFDADCQAGSHCIRPSGAIYGVCAGEFSRETIVPQPFYPPPDLEMIGNRCTLDIDCGLNNRCLKTAATNDGVCVRGERKQ